MSDLEKEHEIFCNETCSVDFCTDYNCNDCYKNFLISKGITPIPLKLIKKIQNLSMKIFEYEDDDYPNYRGVRACERAIHHYLSKITDDKEKQIEIYDLIEKHNFNMKDITFKPICDDLRKKRYVIIYEKVRNNNDKANNKNN